MSVLATSTRVDYTLVSSIASFAYTFPVLQKTDLQVWTDDTNIGFQSPEGLVLRTLGGPFDYDYTQSNPNFPAGVKGGTITFNTALPVGMKVILLRVVSENDTATYGNFDKWDAKTGLEQSFDLAVMQVQQLREQLNRAIGFAVDVFTVDTDLAPVKTIDYNNKTLIGYDSTGKLVGLQVPAGVYNYSFTTAFSIRVTSFTVPGIYTFTVPPGVTTLYIEVYGASGGGGGGGLNGGIHHGARGEQGGHGGFVAMKYGGFTPGEIIDIYVSAGGAGGIKGTSQLAEGGTGSANVVYPGPGIADGFARRAPNAGDTLLVRTSNGGEGGLQGQDWQGGPNLDAGNYYNNSPLGGTGVGNGNLNPGEPSLGFGYGLYRGKAGGAGGMGGYIVGQREIDLGENEVIDFNLAVNPDAGSKGQDGAVIIYY